MEKPNNNWNLEKLERQALNNQDNIILLRKDLENGVIDECNLTNEQVNKIKELYCSEITNIVYSINNYKSQLKIS